MLFPLIFATPASAEEPNRVSFAAVGDIMITSAVKRTARAAGGSRDGYDSLWTSVSPTISAVDLAFGNLETPIAPSINIPLHDEVFDAAGVVPESLANAGWDVLSLANNHGFDQGITGVESTYNYVAATGIYPVGAGVSRAQAHGFVLVEKNGIRIAFLARADLMNFDPEPSPDQPAIAIAGPRCRVDCGPNRDAIGYTVDVEEIASQARAAREAGADLVILSMHWGIEYQTSPLPYQAPLAERLTDAGIDVILGHHPHVLQPVVARTTTDGRTALIAYSLGNFISSMAPTWDRSQRASAANPRDGVILTFDIVKTSLGTSLERIRALPLWTENNTLTQGAGPTRVHPVLIDQERGGADPLTAALLDSRRLNIVGIVGAQWFDPAEHTP